ncbi:cytochrome c554 and C-prime [Leptospira jelokensis]|nr:cytochrome c554 and C-prime [Leptospira jelokensis]
MYRFRTFTFLCLLICNSYNCSESEILKPMSNGKIPLDIGSHRWKSSKDCESCHKSIYQNHQKSAHANSWKDPIFLEAFQKEPRQWCLNCHAPLHSFGSNHDFKTLSYDQTLKGIWTEGVNCAVCHVRGNQIYGKQTRNDFKDHTVLGDTSFSNNSLCKNCHQFNFPEKHHPKIEYTNVIMQSTGSESETMIPSLSGSNLCVNCHLKSDHRLNGTVFDIEWMEDWKVSTVTQTIGNESIVNLTLKYPKMGHTFPTGDLFRSLVFRVYDKNQNILLEDRFEKKMRIIDLFEVRDTRLSPFISTEVSKSYIIKQVPFECELVYHLQFPIENELKSKFQDNQLHRPIFRDKCSVK